MSSVICRMARLDSSPSRFRYRKEGGDLESQIQTARMQGGIVRRRIVRSAKPQVS